MCDLICDIISCCVRSCDRHWCRPNRPM